MKEYERKKQEEISGSKSNVWVYAYIPSLASSASFFPYNTQQQLRNIMGILPMTTSFCKNYFV
jgi:hypothetical protein